MHALFSGKHPLGLIGCGVGDDGLGGPVQDPALRGDEAVHQPLVQSRHGFDHALAGIHRADRKRHAGIGADDQFLDEHRHGARFRRQTQLLPVEQCPVGPQGSPHPPDVVDNPVPAADIDIGLMDAGERGAGAVLLGGRGTDDGGPVGKPFRQDLLQRVL